MMNQIDDEKQLKQILSRVWSVNSDKGFNDHLSITREDLCFLVEFIDSYCNFPKKISTNFNKFC